VVLLVAGTIKVLVVEVGKEPEIREIPSTLESMQGIVGGYIEGIPLPGQVVLVCNEEGKLNGLPPNFALRNDVIMGNVFFAGDYGKGDFEDIPDEEVEQIKNMVRRTRAWVGK
jgi:hypothetical protein